MEGRKPGRSGRWLDACCRLKISTCVLAEVLRCILVNDTCDTRGDTHGEMDRWRHWCANQRTSRGSVVVGRAGGGGARPSEPEAVLVWAAAAATKQNSEYTRSGLMVGVAVQRGLTCSDAGRGAQVKSVK